MKHTLNKFKFLIEGKIESSFIAEQIAKHSSKTDIGAHTIFLGQVRADNKNGKIVSEIIYSGYEEMVEKEIAQIRENIFQKYEMKCLHIYHSLGSVKAGEISLFVFLSAKHRKDTFSVLEDVVQQIKDKVPIWGKEIFEDESYQWKENNQQ